MVRNAITVPGVTWNPDSEYTPTVTRMSCTTAAMAATAIFHSNRNEMYAEMARKKNTRALMAFLEICLPHEGPTSVNATCVGSVLPNLASSLRTSVLSFVADSL